MESIDPWNVRFSQDSIKPSFRDGETLDALVEGLRSGSIRSDTIPPIRLVDIDGVFYSLDNRRLEAFRRAGVKVPFRRARTDEVQNEKHKFTTRNDGVSIRVRQ